MGCRTVLRRQGIEMGPTNRLEVWVELKVNAEIGERRSGLQAHHNPRENDSTLNEPLFAADESIGCEGLSAFLVIPMVYDTTKFSL